MMMFAKMTSQLSGTPPSARVDAKAASMTLKEYAPMALRRHRASVFKGGGTNEATALPIASFYSLSFVVSTN